MQHYKESRHHFSYSSQEMFASTKECNHPYTRKGNREGNNRRKKTTHVDQQHSYFSKMFGRIVFPSHCNFECRMQFFLKPIFPLQLTLAKASFFPIMASSLKWAFPEHHKAYCLWNACTFVVIRNACFARITFFFRHTRKLNSTRTAQQKWLEWAFLNKDLAGIF